MYAVCVTFELKPAHAAEFLERVGRQAKNSLEREAGCHRFDVCASPDRQTVFLYELYSDRDAFDLHLKSDHFLEFDAATREMVDRKDVRTFDRIAG